LSGFWVSHQASLLAFVGALLLIALSNALSLRRLGRSPWPARFPRVSVLVPARDEEANIGPCVRSLVAQDYPDFEVVVLDDNSTDATPALLAALQVENAHLRVLQGRPLPEDWLGKHWACYQLALAADGELLLFTDADTRHHPATLADAVTALLAEKADLLTAFVREDVESWAERLTVPVMNWSVFSFLPFWLAHRLHIPAYSAANGQLMLFRRSAYDRIGGHAAVRAHPVDDIQLARRIISHDLRWRMASALDRVSCRMYRDLRQVREGFSKNLFAAFGYSIPFFAFVWLWLVIVYCEPLVVVFLFGLKLVPGRFQGLPVSGLSFGLALGAVTCSLLHWCLSYRYLRFPVYPALMYPVSVLVFAAIAIRSVIVTLRREATWKGRAVTNLRRVD
jgi:chlorobactene glucosyltransferase